MVDGSKQKFWFRVGLLSSPLKEPALQQDPLPVDRQQMLRPRNRLRTTTEFNFHITLPPGPIMSASRLLVFRSPLSVFRFPSTVFRLPSSVFRLPSFTVRCSMSRQASLSATSVSDADAGCARPRACCIGKSRWTCSRTEVGGCRTRTPSKEGRHRPTTPRNSTRQSP